MGYWVCYNIGMASIKQNYLSQIKYLYLKKGWSAREIAEKLNVNMDAVYYFFRKNNIPRRNQSEQSKILFERKPLSFSVKKNLSVKEQKLKITGIMLYWAEGSKGSPTMRNWTVDFANSDPKMIKIFLRFLRKICRVDEKRLRAYLYCYSNQNVDDLKKYWSQITKISLSQFTKPYVRQDFSLKSGRVMKYGLIHIRYADKKLLKLIMDWINEYVKRNI